MSGLLDVHNYDELVQLLDSLKCQEDQYNERAMAILQEFSSPKLINHVRNIVMRAVGTTYLPSIINQLDGIISKLDFDLPEECDDIYFANMAFFAKTFFWKNISFFSRKIPLLSYSAATSFMFSIDNLNRLLAQLNADSDLILSPTLALQLAFKNTESCSHDEVEILSLLLKRMNNVPGSHVAQAALKQRLQAIKKPIKLQKTTRQALLLCGQFRDVERTFPLLKNYFDLKNLDVYVSSWQKPGSTRIDRQRLNRRVDASAVEDISRQFTDVELEKIAFFEEARSKEIISNMNSLLKDTFKEAKSLHIFLADDGEVVYQSMDNHQKMYFHNSYWIKKLGHNYFLENYDLLIKARPDMLLVTSEHIGSEPREIPSNEVHCDHPKWLYETWGFGIGDQLFYGSTELMLALLDIRYPQSLSTRILSETFNLGKLVQGHISLGIELWLKGGFPVTIPNTVKRGLATDKKLTKQGFLELAAQVGIAKY